MVQDVEQLFKNTLIPLRPVFNDNLVAEHSSSVFVLPNLFVTVMQMKAAVKFQAIFHSVTERDLDG